MPLFTIAGQAYTPLLDSGLSVDDAVEERSDTSVKMYDTGGHWHFDQGMPVEIDLDDGAQLFTGFVEQPSEQPVPGTKDLIHTLRVVDNVKLAQRRHAFAGYQNWLAGDIVSDLVRAYLADEGVIGQHVTQVSDSQNDWNSGIRTNVAGQSDGTLQLTPLANVTYQPDTQGEWQAGSMSANRQGLTADLTAGADNRLSAASLPALKMTATCTGNGAGSYTYWNLLTGLAWAIASGDKLYYEICHDPNNPQKKGTVDLSFSGPGTNSSTTLRDSGLGDQNGVNAHPATDLSARASGVWYARTFDLSGWVGKNITAAQMAYEAATSATYNMWARRIRILNSSGAVKYTVYDSATPANIGQQSAVNYNTISIANVTAYNTDGTWTGPNVDVSAARGVRGSSISWVLSGGATATVLVSTDGGATWGAACTNGGAVPNLPAGTNVATLTNLKVRVQLATGTCATQGYTASVTLTIQSGYPTSGNRIHPDLDLTPVDVARAATISWNATLNGGTVAVDAALSKDNGATWGSYQAVTNGGTFPGLQLQPVPTFDTFDADSSAAYSVRKNTPGGAGAAVWDPDNSRVNVIADDFVQVFPTGYSNILDCDLFVDVTRAENAALHWRCVHGSGDTGYMLSINDDGNPGRTALTLWRRVNWANTQLAYYDFDFTRGEYHRVMVRQRGATITVLVDGAPVVTVTDGSPITAPGDAGFGSSWNTGTSYIVSFGLAPIGDSTTGVRLRVRETLTCASSNAATPAVDTVTVSVKTVLIQDGATAIETAINYGKCSEAIQQLADGSNYVWNIDHRKRIHFQPRTAQPAPWAAVENAAMWNDLPLIRDGTVTVDRYNPQYMNRAIIPNAVGVTDVQHQTFKGDGANRTFTLMYDLHEVPTVQVNGVTKTVGILGIDSDAHTKDFYWNKGKPFVTQDDKHGPEPYTDVPALTASDTLSVDYTGEFPTAVITEDLAAQAAKRSIEGAGTGIVEAVITVPEGTGIDAANQLGNAKLAKYGVIGRTLKFETGRPGLAPGQVINCYLPMHDLYGDPLLIASVNTHNEANVIWYGITAVEGPVGDSWVKLFDRMLQTAPLTIDKVNLGTSSNVAVPVSFVEQTALAESWSVQVNPGSVPSSTLYPGSTLYPC